MDKAKILRLIEATRTDLSKLEAYVRDGNWEETSIIGETILTDAEALAEMTI